MYIGVNSGMCISFLFLTVGLGGAAARKGEETRRGGVGKVCRAYKEWQG
jgi:hypothetical protein